MSRGSGARVVGAIVTCAALGFATSVANADVEVRGDRALDARRLEDLVTLELGATSHTEHVLIEVSGSRAEIELRRPTGSTSRGSLEVPATGDRERALALFVGELARTTDDRDATPESAVAPAREDVPLAAPPPTSRPADAASRPADSTSRPPGIRAYALAGAGARVMTSGAAIAFMARLEGGLRPSAALRVGLAARYAHASADDALGAVRAHAVTGGAAATLSIYSRSTLAIATGPRLELGWIGGIGDGRNGRSASALAASGAWELEVHVPVGGVTLVGSVEGGSLVRGLDLRADDRTVLELSGAFVGASVGASL